MGIAIWCNLKDNGHAFDEREAIVVSGKNDVRDFCRAHCIPAFVVAFHTARIEGESDIYLPTPGGYFRVLPQDSQPAQDGPPHDGKPRKDTPGADGPSRVNRSCESAQAIADLPEQGSRPCTGEPAATK